LILLARYFTFPLFVIDRFSQSVDWKKGHIEISIAQPIQKSARQPGGNYTYAKDKK